MRPFPPRAARRANARSRALLCGILAASWLLTAAARTAAAEPFFLPLDREGAWTAPDRQVHFAGSLAIAASIRVEGRTAAEAVAATALVGIAKEVYDATIKPRRLSRGASRKDLAADLLGALAGVLIVAAADR